MPRFHTFPARNTPALIASLIQGQLVVNSPLLIRPAISWKGVALRGGPLDFYDVELQGSENT